MQASRSGDSHQEPDDRGSAPAAPGEVAGDLDALLVSLVHDRSGQAGLARAHSAVALAFALVGVAGIAALVSSDPPGGVEWADGVLLTVAFLGLVGVGLLARAEQSLASSAILRAFELRDAAAGLRDAAAAVTTGHRVALQVRAGLTAAPSLQNPVALQAWTAELIESQDRTVRALIRSGRHGEALALRAATQELSIAAGGLASASAPSPSASTGDEGF